MKSATKLPSDERRAAIIKAVRRVFADKGFHGTTTRELASAAGVSEALLYKHFPNKESLFAVMQLSCYGAQYHGKLQQLMEMEASAATLVLMVHYLISHVVHGSVSRDDEMAIYSRLMLRSLAEDGEFARLMLRRPASNWVPKCIECLRAAAAVGDAQEGLDFPSLAGWFAYQLATMIRTYLQPAQPVVDFGVSHDALVEQAVGFILRGMGLKEEAIRRYCNPQALAVHEAYFPRFDADSDASHPL
jgi:AcrR family transcriptional regulator